MEDICCEVACGADACPYCGACRTEHSEDSVTDCPENPKHRTSANCERIKELEAENANLKELKAELLLAVPNCCWRKCWNCKKVQIHHETITPGVLCRFCGSQDTRILSGKTQALKG